MSSLYAIYVLTATAVLAASIPLLIWESVRGRAIAKAAVGVHSSPMAATLPGKIGVALMAFGVVVITAFLLRRFVDSGHAPFSNAYEFALSFSWGAATVGLYLLWRSRLTIAGIIGAVMSVLVLLYARTLPGEITPLTPALQNGLLLSVHVAAAATAYGALSIGFGVAILYLVWRRRSSYRQFSEQLEDLGHRAVLIGFPFLTLAIVLGSIWGYLAWGRYWGWDPKESASLASWLIYAGYLHLRTSGRRPAAGGWLLVLGFGAVLFTFFGSYVFASLHDFF